jgi:tetratricopeptide (TPR) repeat protein
MLLKTLGDLSLSYKGKDIEVGKNELIILAHLLIDGPQTREQLANKIWHTKKFDLAQDGTSLAQANLKSALSRLRSGLRKGTKQDVLEVSDRSTTLALGKHAIRCDYLDLLEQLENPSPETDSIVKSSLNLEFLKGLEFSNRLDIRGDLEHPLFSWLQTKREVLKRKVDEVFAGQRLRSTVQTQSVQTLLGQEPSSTELNNLYVFCQSGDYPFDERQRRKDIASIFAHFNNLYNLEDERSSQASTSVILLALVALAEDKLKAIYLEDALNKYNEVQKNVEQNLIDLWGMLEELQDDDWLSENETLVLKHPEIVKGWLTQNSRLAATLLWSLLQVTPADEGELLGELYSSPPELIKQLAKTQSDITLLAARENLKRELPERAAELLNYGLQNVLSSSQNNYAYLLLSYAYERAGYYEKALQTLRSRSNYSEGEQITLKQDNSLPYTPRDAEILESYILLKQGKLEQEEFLELEAQAAPNNISWAEAKRFNLLGTYYLQNAKNSKEGVGKLEKAIRYFQMAGMIWSNLGVNNNVIAEHNNVAITYAVFEKFDEASRQFEYALQQAVKLNVNAIARLRILFSFASAQINSEKYERALELFAECFKILGAKNYQTFLVKVSFNQGRIYDLHLGNKNEAEKYYELTRDIAIKIDDQAMRGRAIASLGFVKQEKFLVDSGINLIRQSGDTSDLEDYLEERNTLWPQGEEPEKAASGQTQPG